MPDRLGQKTVKHASSGELLGYQEGELKPRRAARVKAHLDSCWQCRSKLRALQDSIDALNEFNELVQSSGQLAPPDAFAGFARELTQVVREPRECDWVGNIRAFLYTRPVAQCVALGLVLLIAGILAAVSSRRLPAPRVAPVVAVHDSQPAVGLLPAKPRAQRGPVQRLNTSPGAAATPAEPEFSPASPDLEVELLAKLDRMDALLEDKISVTRTNEGGLLISGVVESEQRRQEVVRGLGPAAAGSAVRLDIRAVDEAEQRGGQTDQTRNAASTVTAESFGQYLPTRHAADGTLDKDVRHLATAISQHSARARSHAMVLKRVLTSFSISEIEDMAPESRKLLGAIVRRHAEAVRRYLALLRQPLQRAIQSDSSATRESLELSLSDVSVAATRAFELISRIDDQVNASLAASPANRQVAPFESPKFWELINRAETLASALAESAAETE
jgi:hypothetical protein